MEFFLKNLLKSLKEFYKKYEVIIKVLFIPLFLFLLTKTVNFKEIYHLIVKIDPVWIFISYLIILLSNLCGNMSWFHVLRALKQNITFCQTVRPFWLGLLFNNVLPTNVGGDVVKGISVVRDIKNPLTITFSILADRIIGFSVLIIIGVLSAFFIFEKYMFLLAAAVLVSFFIFSLFYSQKTVYRFMFFFVKNIPFKGLRKTFARLVVYYRRIFKDKVLFLKILFFMTLSQLGKIFLSYGLVTGLGSSASISYPKEYVFLVVPASGILSLVSLTPGGAGSREYFLGVLFKKLGNMQSMDYVHEMLAVNIAAFFLVILASLPGLIFLLKKENFHTNEKHKN